MTKHRLFNSGLIVMAAAFLLLPTFNLTLANDGQTDNKTTVSTSGKDSAKDVLENAKPETESIRDQVKTERDDVTSALADLKNATATDRLAKLIAVGDKVVAARQKALTALQTRLTTGNCSGISTDIKTLINTDVAAVNATLTTQKATIDAATTAADARTAIKAVYSNNRVFIHFIPAASGLCSSERIIEITASTKITAALATLTAAGIDTTAITADLNAAKTSATVAQLLFKGVAANPGDTNTSATTDLKTALQDMSSAKDSLGKAKDAIESALEQLKTEDANQ